MLLRILSLLFRRKQSLPLLQAANLRRVLLMRYDRLGDAIITTPILAALKVVSPDVEIDVLCSRANMAYFNIDPRVSQMFLWVSSPIQRIALIRRMRRRKYDAVLQLMLNKTTLRSILAGIIAPDGRTIGKSMPGHDALLNHAIEIPAAWHFSNKTYAVFSHGFEFSPTAPSCEYSLPAARAEESARTIIRNAGGEADEFVMINISAGSPDREFTEHNNMLLARMLINAGYRVGITGAPKDGERIRRIAGEAGRGVMPLAFPGLAESISGIGMAKVVVTPDTAVVHMASALGRPVVVAYTMVGDPSGWGPVGVPFRMVRTNDVSINGISVDELVACVKELAPISAKTSSQ